MPDALTNPLITAVLGGVAGVLVGVLVVYLCMEAAKRDVEENKVMRRIEAAKEQLRPFKPLSMAEVTFSFRAAIHKLDQLDRPRAVQLVVEWETTAPENRTKRAALLATAQVDLWEMIEADMEQGEVAES